MSNVVKLNVKTNRVRAQKARRFEEKKRYDKEDREKLRAIVKELISMLEKQR
jgi:hypothetical protein